MHFQSTYPVPTASYILAATPLWVLNNRLVTLHWYSFAIYSVPKTTIGHVPDAAIGTVVASGFVNSFYELRRILDWYVNDLMLSKLELRNRIKITHTEGESRLFQNNRIGITIIFIKILVINKWKFL